MSEVRCGTCRHFQRDDPVCVGCTDIGTPFYRKWEPVENATMPQSTKERQEALRARRAIEGAAEVRGIYLPLDLHATLKAMAKKLSAKKPAPATESSQSEESMRKKTTRQTNKDAK